MGGGLDEHKEVSAGYEIAVDLLLPTGNFFMACVIEDDVSPPRTREWIYNWSPIQALIGVAILLACVCVAGSRRKGLKKS